MAELRIAEEAMSLQAGCGIGARTLGRNQRLQLRSVLPNSRQGDPLQLIEQIT